jgi:hypothetical protein
MTTLFEYYPVTFRGACQYLGIPRYKVMEWIKKGVFVEQIHYRIVYPDGIGKGRPEYSFDLVAIEKLFEV